jgi:hypothetical protein
MTDDTALDELQQALLVRLVSDPAIMAIAADVYDRVPDDPFITDAGETRTAYISFGAQDAPEDDAECISGISVTTQIDIWSVAYGRVECRRLTDLVRRRLHKAPLVLMRAAVGEVRVVLTRIIDDSDPQTTHGVVQVTAFVEELD